MKSIEKVGIGRHASAKEKEIRISVLADALEVDVKPLRSPLGKLKHNESMILSKAGSSTQDTLINGSQRPESQVRKCHKRTATDISNLSQFENVDEETEVRPHVIKQAHIKKSPIPQVVDNTNEFGEILKVRK